MERRGRRPSFVIGRAVGPAAEEEVRQEMEEVIRVLQQEKGMQVKQNAGDRGGNNETEGEEDELGGGLKDVREGEEEAPG